MKITFIYVAILSGISIFIFFTLFYSLSDYPLRSEEGIYARSAISFIEWKSHPRPFQKEVLTEYWNVCGEHPSIIKISSAITWLLFHKKLGDLFSLRLATLIYFSLLPILSYMFGILFLRRPVSLTGSIFILCIPGVIESAHFAEININLAFFWVLASYFFLRAQMKEGPWISISGAIAGLAAGAKITTLALLITILIWLLIYARGRWIRDILLFTGVGIVIFLVAWPSLWVDNPVTALISHIKYHIPEINMRQPWYSVPVSLFSIIPLGFMVLFPLGIIRIFLEKNKGGMFCLILLLVFLGFFSIFKICPPDWFRYLLPLIPFFTIICAMGLDFLARPLIKRNIIYV